MISGILSKHCHCSLLGTVLPVRACNCLTNEALMIGVETRTSSPVRIVRDKDSLQHISVKGLFPCGEGAGYAGGIVSAAIDGERCAEKLVEIYGGAAV